MKRNKLFAIFSFISALSLASCAGYFSIFGLSKLFSGAAIPVIVMASSLELAKLVLASYLYRYWKKTKSLLKIYLTTGVVILSIITSVGAYGFLSNAYQSISDKYEVGNQQISFLQSKVDIFKQSIKKDSSEQSLNDQRIKTLTNLRTEQEVRLDSLYKKNQYYLIRITEKDIAEANTEIQKLSKKSDSLTKCSSVLNDSINNINLLVLNENTKNSSNEIGPLKYISKLTGLSMDKTVNYLILLIISVFDPLAISLVIATNIILLDKEDEKNKDTNKKEESSEIQTEQEYKEDKKEEIENKEESSPKQEEETKKEEIVKPQEEKKEVYRPYVDVRT